MKVRIIKSPNNHNNTYARGGGMSGNTMGGYHTNGLDWELPGNYLHIGTGGTHELNKNEGVPQGYDPQGTPNLVEENEVVYNDYVFSNRLIVPRTNKGKRGKDKEISDLAWEQKLLKPFQGMTYADAAQKAYKKVQERPNDDTERRGLEVTLGVLAGSLEKERAKKEHLDAKEEIDLMSGLEFVLMQELEKQALEMAQQQQQLLMQLELNPQELEQIPLEEQLMSPEELAMMQLLLQLQMAQEQAMALAGQGQYAALGGNIHAYGGNFYDNGGLLDLQRYLLIFQLIAEYAEANKELLPELYLAVSLVKTPQDMLLFVSLFLAAQQQLAAQLLAMQLLLYAQMLLALMQQALMALELMQQPRAFAEGGGLNSSNPEPDDPEQIVVEKPGSSTATNTSTAPQTVTTPTSPTNNTEPPKVSTTPDPRNETPSQKKKREKLEKEAKEQKKRGIRRVVKKMNRLYKSKGVDVKDLSQNGMLDYLDNIERAWKRSQEDSNYNISDDTELSINSKQFADKKTRKNNHDNYNKQAEDFILSRMNAHLLGVNDNNEIILEAPKDTGLNAVKGSGNSAINFGATDDDFANSFTTYTNALTGMNADNAKTYGIYNYVAPSRLSKFLSLEDLENFYKLQLIEFYNKKTGNNYSTDLSKIDDRVAHHYLSGSSAREFVQKLEAGDVKLRELAKRIKATWGDNNTDWSENATWDFGTGEGLIKESNAYLNSDYSKKTRLRSDTKFGILHSPILGTVEYTPQNGDVYRVKGSDGNYYLVHEPEGGWESNGWEVTPASNSANNYNIYDVTAKPNARKLYRASATGNVYDVTGLNGFEDRETTEDDPKISNSEDKLGVSSSGTYTRRAAPKSDVGDEEKKDTDPTDPQAPEYKTPSTWPYWAGMGLLAGALAYNLLNKADYSNADAIINAANNLQANPVNWRPIGDYLTYRPFDRNYEGNKVIASMTGQRNLLRNLSGGNRSLAMANIMGSDYNLIQHLGEVDRQAAEANRKHEQDVATFNRETNKTNSTGLLEADIANQKTWSDLDKTRLDALTAGYKMRDDIDTARSNAINSNISGIANNLFDLYKQKLTNSQVIFGMKTDSFKTSKNNTGAYGGRVRTRRKRGISI